MAMDRGSGGAAAASASGTTITVTNPGYSEGDGLLAVLFWGTSATISGTPTGFTLVPDSALSLSTNVRCAVYQKIATGSEPSTYVFTMSATGSFGRCVIRDYTNPEPTGFASGVVSTTGTNSTTLTWPSITRDGEGPIVCFGSQATARTPSAAPTGYTDQYTTTPRFGYFFDRMDAPDGSNSFFSRTLDNGSGGHALGRLVLVEAASAGESTTGGGMLLKGVG